MFIPVFELAGCSPTSMPLIATDGSEPLPVVAEATPSAVAAVAPTQPLSVSGTWLSMFGGGVQENGTLGPDSPVTLRLVQIGSEVSGQYRSTPGGRTTVAPGTVTGTLSGNLLTGTWRDTTGVAGTFRFEMAQGGGAFSGVWAGYRGGRGSWNGQRAGAPAEDSPPTPQEDQQGFIDVRGTWLTEFEAGSRRLQVRVTLMQNLPGNHGLATRMRAFRERPCRGSPGLCVSGLYQNVGGGGDGSLYGVLSPTTGDFFLGDWRDVAGGRGGVTFRFNRDGQSFTGAWYSGTPGTPGARRIGFWNGRRLGQ